MPIWRFLESCCVNQVLLVVPFSPHLLYTALTVLISSENHLDRLLDLSDYPGERANSPRARTSGPLTTPSVIHYSTSSANPVWP
jgi:hypothetical protein